MPRGEIIGHVVPVEHGDCHLGKLEIKANTQRHGLVHRHGNKASEIDGAGDVDKVHILLTSEINVSILHWEEQAWIASNGGIFDACNSRVMVRDDDKVPKIEPRGVKETVPIMHHATNNVPQFSWEPIALRMRHVSTERASSTLLAT